MRKALALSALGMMAGLAALDSRFEEYKPIRKVQPKQRYKKLPSRAIRVGRKKQYLIKGLRP